MNFRYGEGWTGEYLPDGWTRTVPFTAGDGISEYIEVSSIAEFPRGKNGRCAYCYGDPCAEYPVTPDTQQIHDFYLRNKLKRESGKSRWFPESCPCCGGRAT